MGVKHPELVVAAAAASCLPMVPGLLAGQITAVAAGERFLVALVVCWVLGSILSWVLTTYSQQAQRAELMRMVEGPNDRATGADPATGRGPAAE